MENVENIEEIETEELQLAENVYIENYESDNTNSFKEKRELLENTKIVKQTWSILEIYQKIKDKKLRLSPEYQRNVIWDSTKQTAFIESLFMGILIPPIYVVEIPGAKMLEDNSYEVVDGKQRLTAIDRFLNNSYALNTKSLEYYADMFGDKRFNDLESEYSSYINTLLSSVLDIYVITANSPEFTKYDIFSRLNKGSEPLRVNEIRKAIYRSDTLVEIESFVTKHLDETNEEIHAKYINIFSKTDIQRFEDYGRFYRSIAFYMKSVWKDEETPYVDNYNSRPREMINDVLQKIQKNIYSVEQEELIKILNFTLNLSNWLLDNNYPQNQINYIIDASCPFLNFISDFEILKGVFESEDFTKTFTKSPSTTTNVNERLKLMKSFLGR